MIFILLCLATLLAISNAIDSSYVIHTYVVPDQADVLTPYPIGVCVIYELLSNQPPSDPQYATFFCNGANNVVTRRSYGTSFDCHFLSEAGDLVVSDDAAEPGKLGYYNCGGTQNYAVTDSCAAKTDPDAVEPAQGSDSGQLCCDNSLCTEQTYSTDVCVWNADDSVYITVKCDEFGVTRESYADAGCTTGTTVFDEYDEDQCEYVGAASGWDIHKRLITCVEDTDPREDITNSSYSCAPTQDPTSSPSMEPTTITDAPSLVPTSSPTMEPTQITKAPSRAPTMEPTTEPTQITEAPSRAPSPEEYVPQGNNTDVIVSTTEDDDSKVGRYFIGYVLSLAIVVGCFMVN